MVGKLHFHCFFFAIVKLSHCSIVGVLLKFHRLIFLCVYSKNRYWFLRVGSSPAAAGEPKGRAVGSRLRWRGSCMFIIFSPINCSIVLLFYCWGVWSSVLCSQYTFLTNGNFDLPGLSFPEGGGAFKIKLLTFNRELIVYFTTQIIFNHFTFTFNRKNLS